MTEYEENMIFELINQVLCILLESRKEREKQENQVVYVGKIIKALFSKEENNNGINNQSQIQKSNPIA